MHEPIADLTGKIGAVMLGDQRMHQVHRRGAPGTAPVNRYGSEECLMPETAIERAARATPPGIAHRVRGLSDRAIAWIFVAPTIFLLLAINIFPLLWTIYLSFTNYRANRPNALMPA